MSDNELWQCTACGKECEPVIAGEPNIPCIGCGSLAKTLEVHFEDTVDAKITDWLEAKATNVKMTGKRKMRRHLQTGSQWSYARQKYVDKVRDIDRDADTYLERVTDPDTGEVIHHCDEPLSEHFKHGSAKPTGD